MPKSFEEYDMYSAKNIIFEFKNTIFSAFNKFWNYEIILIEGDPVKSSNIIIALLTFAIGIRYIRKFQPELKNYLNNKFIHDKDAANAFENIISYTLIALLVSIVLQIAHIPIRAFAFIGGALAIGIGLGAQNLMNNFISSMIILLDKPVKIGDLVEISGVKGYVSSIGTRCLKIRTADMSEVLIPNSKLIQENLINWTLSNDQSKFSVKIKFYKDSQLNNNSSANYEPSVILDQIQKVMTNFEDQMKMNSREVYFLGTDENYYIYMANFLYDSKNIGNVTRLQSNISIELCKEFGYKNIIIEF